MPVNSAKRRSARPLSLRRPRASLLHLRLLRRLRRPLVRLRLQRPLRVLPRVQQLPVLLVHLRQTVRHRLPRQLPVSLRLPSRAVSTNPARRARSCVLRTRRDVPRLSNVNPLIMPVLPHLRRPLPVHRPVHPLRGLPPVRVLPVPRQRPLQAAPVHVDKYYGRKRTHIQVLRQW